jgi:alkylhydroperoxidase/carboxymuconolactone decarboxylase family protein YurZ
MSENILKILSSLDPKLVEYMNEIRAFTFEEGVLPTKYKFLIAMAIDIAKGATQGAKALGELAMKAGATEKEVTETLRVVFYVSTAGSVFKAAHCLNELFK